MQSEPGYRIIRMRHPTPHLLEGLDQFHRALIGCSSTPPEQFMDFVLERLGDETMLLVLAVAGDTPAGYGLAFDVTDHALMPEWQRSGYITQLFVAPEHRRRGLGQQMYSYIVQWLASRGVTEVLLNVSVDNPVAEMFWRKQGFTPHRVRMKNKIPGDVSGNTDGRGRKVPVWSLIILYVRIYSRRLFRPFRVARRHLQGATLKRSDG